MKTIIAGSRSITDYGIVFEGINKALRQGLEITEVVSGTARGVDTLGERWAEETGIPVEPFPANWDKYPRYGGLKRNCKMAEYADALIAIWDGESPGTNHMIDEAHRQGLEVFVYKPYLEEG